MTLEQEMEQTASVLEDWRMRIEIESGWSGVIAERPDGTTVNMDDGELDLAEQVAAVRGLIHDEAHADCIANVEVSGR
jgi:hypothetical protein